MKTKIRESIIKVSKNYNANITMSVIAVIIGFMLIIGDFCFNLNRIILLLGFVVLILFYFILDWLEVIRIQTDNVLEKNKLVLIILSNASSTVRLLLVPAFFGMLVFLSILRHYLGIILILEIILIVLYVFLIHKIAKIISKKVSEKLKT